MKKKMISILLCTVMTAGMLSGCGGSAPASAPETTAPDADTETGTPDADTEAAPAGEEQTLKVAALESGYGAEMWSEVCQAFEASHPGVTIELTTDKKLEDVISPSMKAGDYPDVIHLATGREAGLTETLTKEKGLLDISDILDRTVPGESVKVRDKILPGFLDTLGTMPYGDGVTYYAPMFYGPCGLFYNAGLLKEKNWEVPKTWDEMWELGEKAKAEGIALFTYPTPGYFDAFLYAMLVSSGGVDFYNDAMMYQDGAWESAEAKAVGDIIGKLAGYTEKTTVANANDDNFTKNQQLVLDNKAIFCPNGTWLPGEMKDAPRADGFEWGFAPVPSVKAGGNPTSFTFFEQLWVPAEAKNQDMAKEFVAYMYSDEAANIFAKSGAIQPIVGISDKLEGDNKMFYSIYDNGVIPVMGGFASTEPVEGVTIRGSLLDPVNSIMSGDKTVDEWLKGIEEASDKLREAM